MHTINGVQGQFHFNGLQTTSNGTQGQPGVIRQQINQFDGGHHPVHVSCSQGVSIPQATYNPMGHLQGQQLVNMNGTHTMPIRNRPGVPTYFDQAHMPVNTQHNQQRLLQPQHGSPIQPLFSPHGSSPMMATVTSPNAMASMPDLWTSFSPQPDQVQNLQASYASQGFQHLPSPNQPTNHAQAVHQTSSGSNTPILFTAHAHTDRTNRPIKQNLPSAAHPKPARGRRHTAPGRQYTGVERSTQTTSPAEPVSTGNAVAAERAEPAESTEISKDFQDHVKGLLEERGGTFRGHIRNKADLSRYEQAVKAAKGKSIKVEDKSDGYPTTDSGRLDIIHRISDAFFKLDGEQDPVSDSADNVNCYALKAIRATSPIEVEIVAYKLMDDMLRVQRGEHIRAKVVQEKDFMVKVDEVVEALSFNKLLCRSAMTTAEWITRIAADPASERHQKKSNVKNNNSKGRVLKQDATARGKARSSHGKAKPKGKANNNKRQVKEQEEESETAAESSDAVSASQTAA